MRSTRTSRTQGSAATAASISPGRSQIMNAPGPMPAARQAAGHVGSLGPDDLDVLAA